MSVLHSVCVLGWVLIVYDAFYLFIYNYVYTKIYTFCTMFLLYYLYKQNT